MTLRLSGGRKLLSPPGQTARPTTSRVRLAAMNLLAHDIPGCGWLDLCCGSGLMACEALQRGAQRVVAIEQDRQVARIAKANLETVAQGLGHGPKQQVVQAEVLSWLGKGKAAEGCQFQLIYADPPYQAELYGQIGSAVLKGEWLSPGGLMVWECSSRALPAVPEGWLLEDQRSYGTTSLMLLKRAN
ncbi:16S rRNA (guanine(966)-N(2))-methyltransferase RsmD [Cyanobium sp. HWJ4-Hawea]|uniref:16S rRNA (guanine(966)-N(2))-methyltransferase RsmD n=1 Tax=Cyanobium sp. HWJ4-Hawea TaxID=2823713 RepID=UPI0020CF5976|nr:16S rRNA (guanine(966)-N(2))-methyltransferase RsmD [Cyanobium sp. HWJ4-Hawea]MCP9809198.1 16S rRNA (guanine(966)-N(2))-methyltransferase RsmD [Cyanobium sp. HWJ4-Hawea]